MSKSRHIGAGVPVERLPSFGVELKIIKPSETILNVIRVALNNFNMSYYSTGFKDCEIDAAKEWVKLVRGT